MAEQILGNRFTYSTMKDSKPEEKELRKYNCLWCGTKFQQYVKYGGKQGTGGERGNVSDQVVCPNCNNGLKTW